MLVTLDTSNQLLQSSARSAQLLVHIHHLDFQSGTNDFHGINTSSHYEHAANNIRHCYILQSCLWTKHAFVDHVCCALHTEVKL
jgi:hypothetical protein